jgi:hypothetical protein
VNDSGVRGFQCRPVHYQTVHTAPGTTPRLALYTPRPYTYRGTGEDTLTAFMDDEPADRGLSRRRERMEMLDGLRFAADGEHHPPAGVVTARQAAEMLGVSERTIERYKRDLRRSA